MRARRMALVGTVVGILYAVASAAHIQITRGPIIEVADSTSATIVWSTSLPSIGRVWYSEDADDLTQIAEGPDQTTEHSVRIEGLQPNTTYFFQVESVQSNTSTATENSIILSFRTVAHGQQAIRNQKATLAQKSVLNFGEDENLKR